MTTSSIFIVSVFLVIHTSTVAWRSSLIIISTILTLISRWLPYSWSHWVAIARLLHHCWLLELTSHIIRMHRLMTLKPRLSTHSLHHLWLRWPILRLRHSHNLQPSYHPWLRWSLHLNAISSGLFSFKLQQKFIEVFYFVINMFFTYIMLFPPERRRMM